MTKRQREQVVELLRCAADLCVRGYTFPVLDAEEYLEADKAVIARSYAVRCALNGFPYCMPRDQYLLLEAAQRVEDGEWP